MDHRSGNNSIHFQLDTWIGVVLSGYSKINIYVIAQLQNCETRNLQLISPKPRNYTLNVNCEFTQATHCHKFAH